MNKQKACQEKICDWHNIPDVLFDLFPSLLVLDANHVLDFRLGQLWLCHLLVAVYPSLSSGRLNSSQQADYQSWRQPHLEVTDVA